MKRRQRKKKSHHKIIRVKYCGGCNPGYDRVEAVEAIRNALERKAVVSTSYPGQPDVVLAVQGCETGCADLSPFRDVEVIVISSPNDIKRAIQQLKKAVR
ncbi:MAG: hypothetical protein R6X10_17840 [Desulfobacterales bacterium]